MPGLQNDKNNKRKEKFFMIMLYDIDRIEQDMSVIRCNTRFGCYGMFATLPLYTAVITRNGYDPKSFRLAIRRCFQNQSPSTNLTSFIRTLDFPDSEFFTFEEICFLMQIRQPFLPRTQQQLETDRQELTDEARHGTRIFKSHARILLKALSFWELRHSEKWEEWRDALKAAFVEDRRRKQVPPEMNDEPRRRPLREYVPRNRRPRREYVPRNRRPLVIANVTQASPVSDVDEGYGSS